MTNLLNSSKQFCAGASDSLKGKWQITEGWALVTGHKGTTNFGIHKLTSHYHTEAEQELNSAAVISGKNLNKTCCHNRSPDPKTCGEANCAKRLHKLWSSLVLSVIQDMEQFQRNTRCWMPKQPSASALAAADSWEQAAEGENEWDPFQVYHLSLSPDESQSSLAQHQATRINTPELLKWALESGSTLHRYLGDSRVRSKCSVPSFSMEPSGSRDTHGVKKHVTMLSFMKTLCHKIHMELQLREAKAWPRHTCLVIAHLHSHTRTEPASLTSRENFEIHLCYATVLRVCNICWACDNSCFRAEVFYTF